MAARIGQGVSQYEAAEIANVILLHDLAAINARFAQPPRQTKDAHPPLTFTETQR